MKEGQDLLVINKDTETVQREKTYLRHGIGDLKGVTKEKMRIFSSGVGNTKGIVVGWYEKVNEELVRICGRYVWV